MKVTGNTNLDAKNVFILIAEELKETANNAAQALGNFDVKNDDEAKTKENAAIFVDDLRRIAERAEKKAERIQKKIDSASTQQNKTKAKKDKLAAKIAALKAKLAQLED